MEKKTEIDLKIKCIFFVVYRWQSKDERINEGNFYALVRRKFFFLQSRNKKKSKADTPKRSIEKLHIDGIDEYKARRKKNEKLAIIFLIVVASTKENHIKVFFLYF